MHQPLEGIRVLEWGVFHAGPGGTAMLGDMGAEVIKIERPGEGDPERNLDRIGQTVFTLPKGRNLFFEASNRNKKSIEIDLSTKAGKEIVYRLVADSDVFLTNLRFSTVEKMEMTYATLSQFNPQLIYAYVSGYGPRGVDSDRGAYDPLGQARAGLMYAVGEPDMPPLLTSFAVLDQATAIMACLEIVTALLMRERFGIGQEVHTSILGTTLCLQYVNVLAALLTGKAVPRHERASADAIRNYYQCGDGKWLILTLTPPERYWASFCHTIGHPDLEKDPRFVRNDARFQNSEALVKILDGIFTTKTRHQWIEAFDKTDIPFAAVNSPLELLDDPQIVDNDYIVDFDHPVLGKIKIPGFPIHFSKSRAATVGAAPELGADTDWVLQNVGGYSEGEIAQLREEKVI